MYACRPIDKNRIHGYGYKSAQHICHRKLGNQTVSPVGLILTARGPQFTSSWSLTWHRITVWLYVSVLDCLVNYLQTLQSQINLNWIPGKWLRLFLCNVKFAFSSQKSVRLICRNWQLPHNSRHTKYLCIMVGLIMLPDCRGWTQFAFVRIIILFC